ncbi:UAA transporter [Cubamyces lactineus]|nr:UAA transporter [Cubamyces lactineus]
MEQLTREHPRSGSLITFAQFVLISLHGLPKFVVFAPLGSSLSSSSPSPPSSSTSPTRSASASTSGPTAQPRAPGKPAKWWTRVPVPRLRPRRTPLAPYLAQVALFYAVSLLNNAAFGYAIPMSVHIIFRSGGLVISMLMGWLLAGKRYNLAQVLSVLVVTVGVVLTTLSASAPKQSKAPSSSATSAMEDTEPSVEGFLSQEQWRYATGIAILTFALVLSGVLGIVQDWTYARYVRVPAPTSTATTAPISNGHSGATANGASNGHANGHAEKTPAVSGEKPASHTTPAHSGTEPWQESMFYLHFLSLPMFYFVRHDLAVQARAFYASPPLAFSLAFPSALRPALDRALTLYPPFGLSKSLLDVSLRAKDSTVLDVTLPIPSAFVALALTAVTAHVCVAGVHRLTARGVSALAVTLLLVVRKATSLVLSVMLFRTGGAVNAGVWAGAGMVFAGTMGYAAGSRKRAGAEKGEEKRKRE